MKNKKGHPFKSSPKQFDANNRALPLGKIEGMFTRFAEGERHHRFSAELIGDHCLPTTISDIQITRGIRFSREWVKVRNRFGGLTSVRRYWLEGEDLTKSRKILGLDEGAL